MLPRTEREIFAAPDRRSRFDLDSVREILGRAAVEQHRLDVERDDTYTRDELEEMAAEAGISREALARALRHGRAHPSAPRRGRSWQRWLPRAALALLAGLAFVGLMLAFPAVAEFLFWTVIVLLVLVLLGAAPI
jgi:hypothetical protein